MSIPKIHACHRFQRSGIRASRQPCRPTVAQLGGRQHRVKMVVQRRAHLVRQRLGRKRFRQENNPALEYAVVQAEGTTIRPRDLLREVVAGASSPAESAGPGAALTHYYQPAVDASAERALIMKVLEESGGNKAQAARRLGMSRTTLWKRLSQSG